MAMSIDEGMDVGSSGAFATGQRQNVNLTAKARREVCDSLSFSEYVTA